ncbi:hypothetical protein BX667DRAFT_461872, partial [Coemansia mojavensis]
YKTALCRSFEEGSQCKYGENCRFAHGKDELRQRINPLNYKTALCRNEADGKPCPYGAKCDYVHQSDIKHTQSNQNKNQF